MSPVLARFSGAEDPGYQEALSIVRAGKARLAGRPRADMPGFIPCEADRKRETIYTNRRGVEMRNRAAITEGLKVYDE